MALQNLPFAELRAIIETLEVNEIILELVLEHSELDAIEKTKQKLKKLKDFRQVVQKAIDSKLWEIIEENS